MVPSVGSTNNTQSNNVPSPTLDATTLAVMKLEVQKWWTSVGVVENSATATTASARGMNDSRSGRPNANTSNQNGSRPTTRIPDNSLLAMANALLGSRTVLDVHAEATGIATSSNTIIEEAAAKLQWGGRLDNTPNKSSSHIRYNHATGGTLSWFALQRQKLAAGRSFFPSSNNSQTHRRYELVNALNRLQLQAGAATTPIASWDDAVRALSTVFILPCNDDDDDDENNAHTNDDDDMAVDNFLQRLQTIRLNDATPIGLRESQSKWLSIAKTSVAAQSSVLVQEQAEKAAAELERVNQRQEDQLKQARQEELAALHKRILGTELRPLEPMQRQRIQDAMQCGSDADPMPVAGGSEPIQRRSFRLLAPGQWLNDEILHAYLDVLARRDATAAAAAAGSSDPSFRRSHFFKSFFITKLCDDARGYSYSNVKRWSKNVPGMYSLRNLWDMKVYTFSLEVDESDHSVSSFSGKDIFNLDKIIFPVNQGDLHWTMAAIFMKEKRIQYYDSFGGNGEKYVRDLFRYLQDEHRDKKKCDLPEADSWTLVFRSVDDTPRQRNGVDCGVFVCMFADFLAQNYPLCFSQDDLPRCRERVALAILEGHSSIQN